MYLYCVYGYEQSIKINFYTYNYIGTIMYLDVIAINVVPTWKNIVEIEGDTFENYNCSYGDHGSSKSR